MPDRLILMRISRCRSVIVTLAAFPGMVQSLQINVPENANPGKLGGDYTKARQ